MERCHIFCVALVIWVSFTLCVSAPAAVESRSKEVVDAVLIGKTNDVNTEDDNVEALHSLATDGLKLDKISLPSNLPNESNKTIHEAKNHNTERLMIEDKRSSEMFSELATSKDTPRDMAEYIFWTGDDNGVTKAISDFVDQGLMSQDEGISFLEEVKYHLELLQQKYGTSSAVAGLGESTQQGNEVPKSIVSSSKSTQNQLGKAAKGDEAKDSRLKTSISVDVEGTKAATSDSSVTEMKDRLELAELLSNEYTLEEIIYQLSRILFTQSLSQEGSAEAEEALQRFADFLEKDSKEGRLSPQLQKKVLDVLLMALFDALGDQSRAAPHVKHLNLGFMKKPSLLKNP